MGRTDIRFWKAPFGQNRKDEFQDACALLAVEQLCRKNKQSCYVISRNKDWSRYAATCPNVLHHIESLEEYLDLLLKNRQGANLVREIFQSHPEIFETAVRET